MFGADGSGPDLRHIGGHAVVDGNERGERGDAAIACFRISAGVVGLTRAGGHEIRNGDFGGVIFPAHIPGQRGIGGASCKHRLIALAVFIVCHGADRTGPALGVADNAHAVNVDLAGKHAAGRKIQHEIQGQGGRLAVPGLSVLVADHHEPPGGQAREERLVGGRGRSAGIDDQDHRPALPACFQFLRIPDAHFSDGLVV